MSVLEVIVAASIILILTAAIAQTWRSYLLLTRTNTERIQIALLLEEGSEIVGFLRDTSWTTYIAPLSLNTPYYLAWTGSAYQATTTSSVINSRFTRTATLSSVIRDANDNIAASGVADTKTKKVTLRVTSVADPSISGVQEILIHDIYTN
jgi:hypothetical protein